jgi:hypothetical protein
LRFTPTTFVAAKPQPFFSLKKDPNIHRTPNLLSPFPVRHCFLFYKKHRVTDQPDTPNSPGHGKENYKWHCTLTPWSLKYFIILFLYRTKVRLRLERKKRQRARKQTKLKIIQAY